MARRKPTARLTIQTARRSKGGQAATDEPEIIDLNARPDDVASSTAEGAMDPRDEFMLAVVENINSDTRAVSEAACLVLYNMRLDLPEKSQLREMLSTTSVVKYAIKAASTSNTYAIRLFGHLVAGHKKNIESAYRHNVLCSLCRELKQGLARSKYEISLLKLRIGENEEGLLCIQHLKTIMQIMCLGSSDTKEWGCSTLKYVLCQDHGDLSMDVVVKAFTKKASTSEYAGKAATEEVINAMEQHKTRPGVNQEAIKFLQTLVEKYPTSKKKLVEQGLLQILGDILQKKHRKFSEAICAAAQTLTVTVLS